MASWLCLSFLLLLNAVSIRVSAQMLLVNSSIRITCVVPHRPENRKLIVAVEGYRTSEYQLDGESAPGVFQNLYDWVPCGVQAVSCTLIESTGKAYRAALPVQVGGCDARE